MVLSNKRKHYVKVDRYSWSDKIYAFFEEVEGDKEDHINNLLMKPDTVFAFKYNLI